jgi:hypothetical protein
MRTPRWVGHAVAISTGLLQVVGVVTLIGAMVALEFMVGERRKPVTP